MHTPYFKSGLIIVKKQVANKKRLNYPNNTTQVVGGTHGNGKI